MGLPARIGVGAAIAVGAVIGAAWVGLRPLPSPFPSFPGSTTTFETVPLRPGLPPPVDRYFRTAIGDRLPVIHSAVASGRGRITVNGITAPTRYRFTHMAGHSYRHYFEATWFGLPVLRVNEWFVDGRARMELPGGAVDEGPKVDSAANLGLWAESVWLPAILATDSRVRWEPIDDTHARLIVPGPDGEGSFTATFDPSTGLLTSLDTLRWYNVSSDEKVGWHTEGSEWRRVNGMLISTRLSATWANEGEPWIIIDLEEIEYNVDVSRYIRASGI